VVAATPIAAAFSNPARLSFREDPTFTVASGGRATALSARERSSAICLDCSSSFADCSANFAV
jgi:hypothetical protein